MTEEVWRREGVGGVVERIKGRMERGGRRGKKGKKVGGGGGGVGKEKEGGVIDWSLNDQSILYLTYFPVN